MNDRTDWKERLHSSVEGVPGLTPDGKEGPDGPWLNDLDRVEAIVRTFCSDFMRRLGEAIESDDPGAMGKLVSLTKADSDRMNQLFIGTGLPHSMPHTRGPWNTPEQLGRHIGIAMEIEGEQRHAVRDAFMITASEMKTLSEQHVKDPFEDWSWKLDVQVERLTHALLGLPYLADSDE